MKQSIMTALENIEDMGKSGGYREAESAIDCLECLSWFDNYGEQYYRRRMLAVYRICQSQGCIPSGHEETAYKAADALDREPQKEAQ